MKKRDNLKKKEKEKENERKRARKVDRSIER